MNLASLGYLLVAQTTPATAAPTTAAADSAFVPFLALKRWYGSGTLAAPEALYSRMGLIAWLCGLGFLLFLVILAQGPVRAIKQVLDVAGLFRLLGASLGRLKKSARLVAILLGATVVSWTAWQTPLHSAQEKKEELALLLKTKSRTQFAIEQGTLSAITPLRDLLNMGDTLILLVGAGALIFKFSADRWGRFEATSRDRASGGWATVCWGAAGLYAMYRVASLIKEIEGLPPLGGCLFIEVGVVPFFMVLADGILLAWVLVELRGADSTDDESGFDVAGTITLAPAACLACMLAIPARYLATAIGLAVFQDHLPKSWGGSPWLLILLRGWGLVWIQAAALWAIGILGAAAWSDGSWGSTLRGYGRLLTADGGRLVTLVAFLGAAAGATSALAYFAVLAMPAQPWVLLAADSYAHYASLPIGLVGLAAFVELGSRTAPPRKLAPQLPSDGVLYVDTTE